MLTRVTLHSFNVLNDRSWPVSDLQAKRIYKAVLKKPVSEEEDQTPAGCFLEEYSHLTAAYYNNMLCCSFYRLIA